MPIRTINTRIFETVQISGPYGKEKMRAVRELLGGHNLSAHLEEFEACRCCRGGTPGGNGKH